MLEHPCVHRLISTFDLGQTLSLTRLAFLFVMQALNYFLYGFRITPLTVHCQLPIEVSTFRKKLSIQAFRNKSARLLTTSVSSNPASHISDLGLMSGEKKEGRSRSCRACLKLIRIESELVLDKKDNSIFGRPIRLFKF
jgi:hypothetical protein